MTHPKRLGTVTGSSGPARALPGMMAPGGGTPPGGVAGDRPGGIFDRLMT